MHKVLIIATSEFLTAVRAKGFWIGILFMPVLFGGALALQKITEGGFGDCERCGEPIADKRLDAVPDARYCIECQRAIEEEERTAAR